MPVGIKRINGKYRIVEPSGEIATTPNGFARDSGGHKTRDKALRQMRAINAGIAEKGEAPPKTLYVSRPLINAAEFLAWARGAGFSKAVSPDDLHVTIAFSRKPLDWSALAPKTSGLCLSGFSSARRVSPLGDKGAVVLFFFSSRLHARWLEICDLGASWDYDDYHPHITISYDAADVDLSKINPFKGELLFGPERFAEVVEDWDENITEYTL